MRTSENMEQRVELSLLKFSLNDLLKLFNVSLQICLIYVQFLNEPNGYCSTKNAKGFPLVTLVQRKVNKYILRNIKT